MVFSAGQKRQLCSVITPGHLRVKVSQFEIFEKQGCPPPLWNERYRKEHLYLACFPEKHFLLKTYLKKLTFNPPIPKKEKSFQTKKGIKDGKKTN